MWIANELLSQYYSSAGSKPNEMVAEVSGKRLEISPSNRKRGFHFTLEIPADMTPPPPPHHPTEYTQAARLTQPTYPVKSAALFCTCGHPSWRQDGWGELLTSCPVTCCFLVSHQPFLPVPLVTDANWESLLCQNKTAKQGKWMSVFVDFRIKEERILFGSDLSDEW